MPYPLVGCLSVWQPWAGAIFDHGKNVENRSWAWPSTAASPGTLGIHAAGRTASEEALAALWPSRVARTFALPAGVLLGVVTVTGSHPAWRCAKRRCSRWADREGGYHWQLSAPRALETPVAARGSQRLWQPIPEHRALLEALG